MSIDDKIEKKIVCLHQFGKTDWLLRIQGVGDCKICTYDPINNPKCKLYQPITVYTVEVKE